MTFPFILCPFCSHIPVKQLFHSLPILFLHLPPCRAAFIDLCALRLEGNFPLFHWYSRWHYCAFPGSRAVWWGTATEWIWFPLLLIPPSSRSLQILNFEGTRGTSLNISVFNKNRLCWPGYRHTSQLPDIVLAPLLSSSAKQWQTRREKKKREKTDQTEQDNLVANNAGQENRCHFDVLKLEFTDALISIQARSGIQRFWCSRQDTCAAPPDDGW